MAFVFSNLRHNGGVSGKREASLESMGITWEDFAQKRRNMMESLKDDVDKMLNDLCKGTDFSADSIGIPCRRRPSILAMPTVKTPGIVRRRPLVQVSSVLSPTVFNSPPATRSRTIRITSPQQKTCSIITPPKPHSLLDAITEPTLSPTHSPRPLLPTITESPPMNSNDNWLADSPGSAAYQSPSAPSPPSPNDPTNDSPSSTNSNPTPSEPDHTPTMASDPTPPTLTPTRSPPSPCTPDYTTPLIVSPTHKPTSKSPESSNITSMNETFVISSTTCDSRSGIDSQLQEPECTSSNSGTGTSTVTSTGTNSITTCTVSVHDVVRGSGDQCVAAQDKPVSSNTGPQSITKNDGLIKKWNELMNSAMKEHHQQRLKNDAGIMGGVKHGLVGTVARNSPIKAVESQQLRSQRLAEKIAEKAEREAARQRELQLKKEQERSERVRKREERMKRIADNQAAIHEKEKKKLMKLQEGRNVIKENKRKENLKLKERQLAAEQRRQEQERLKKLKFKEIEEERRLVEELHAKRMKLEEEERQKKKEEKAEIERERLKKKDEDRKKPTVVMTTIATTKHKQQSPEKCKRKKNSPKQKNMPPPPALAPTKAAAEKPSLPSKYQDISTYNITPMDKNPLLEADNYNIDDLASDESSDDEDAPKKAVPMWAAPMNLMQTIKQQEMGESSESADTIFPPEELLKSPNLARIFPQLRKRFFKRTSSAQWSSPMLKKK